MIREAVAPAAKGVFITRVVTNEPLCLDHWRLVVEAERFPQAMPGQFIQVLCGESPQDAVSAGMMLRRPFSIGGLRRSGDRAQIELLHRALGRGTRWLSHRAPGDAVNILGPLGTPFPLIADRPFAILVGGGIGLPPLIWLAKVLQAAGKRAVAFCGARTRELLPLTVDGAVSGTGEPALCIREFACAGAPAVVTTDDGTLGMRGLVPDRLSAYLNAHPAEVERTVVYACGPEPMLRETARLCEGRGIPCLVCMERVMACGMGTCQSCVVRTRDETAADGWRYRLCCSDGPVFDSRVIIWE